MTATTLPFLCLLLISIIQTFRNSQNLSLDQLVILVYPLLRDVTSHLWFWWLLAFFQARMSCHYSDPRVAVVCSSYFWTNQVVNLCMYLPCYHVYQAPSRKLYWLFNSRLQSYWIILSTFLSLRSGDYAFLAPTVESSGIAVSVPIPLVSYTVRPGSVSSLSITSFLNIFKVLLLQRKVPCYWCHSFFLVITLELSERFTLLIGMGPAFFPYRRVCFSFSPLLCLVSSGLIVDIIHQQG